MAVTSSGQLKLKDDILDEKQNASTARTNVSLRGLVLDGVNDYSSVDIATNTNSGANPPQTGNTSDHQMSEFYGYDHDFNPANFTWGSTSTTIPTTAFNITKTDNNGNLAAIQTRAKLTYGSSSLSVQFIDESISGNQTAVGADTSSSQTVSYSDISDATKLEVRWRLVDAKITVGSASTSRISAYYKNNGHSVTRANETTEQTVRSAQASTISNFDYTGAYVDVTPSAFGGSHSNNQSYSLEVAADGDGQIGILRLTASGDSINLDLRVTKSNSSTTTHTFTRAYTSSSSPNVTASSFEIPDFTCLHPDMVVKKYINDESDGTIDTKVSDLQVDDMIQTRSNPSDKNSKKKWTRVNEVRSHTRSGYYVVNDRLKITGDHPVWCVDRFVRVEDMGQGTTKEYIDGDQEVYYIGTDDGHYFCYCEGNPGDTRYLVDGNYGSQTE